MVKKKKIVGSNKGKVLISKEELENLRDKSINRASVEDLVDALKYKFDGIIADLEEKKDEIEDIRSEITG